jgi:toxin CcdB
MAQFDIHRNRGSNHEAIPFVVIVQSSIFDDYRRRVVIPLVRKSYLDQVALPRFNPIFNIEDIDVVLHPLEMVSIDVRNLGELVSSLDHSGQQVIDAIDALITRAHH